MKKTIITQKYAWTHRSNIRCAGFAWWDGQLISKGDFCEATKQQSRDFEKFVQWTSGLNGPFAIMAEWDEEIWMATSHTWTYPLFYTHDNESFAAGDIPEFLPKNTKLKIITEDELYFLTFGVTPGNHTLHFQVKTVLPGEVIRLKAGETETVHKLDSWFETQLPESSNEETARRIRETFHRYSDLIGKRKVLLPLTSGYDSRLLACLLKESGHTDVLCSTWGNPTNTERKVAERVAEKLKYPYVFIPYSGKTIAGFAKNQDFEKFVRYTGQLTSMPYLQEYFAIGKLLDEGMIDHDAVVLPGHPGDFLRGSHLTPGLSSEPAKRIAQRIMARFGSDYPLTARERRMVINQITNNYFKGNESGDNRVRFDQWDYIERQCKLIANSSSAWSYFGIEAMHPLFDRELVSFFPSLPLAQRLGSVHYTETLVSQFFQKHGVDFMLRKETLAGNDMRLIKQRLISLMPDFLKKWIYHDTNSIAYREITTELMRSWSDFHFKAPVRPYSYNSYLIQWYLHYIKKTG